jgi:hypothetical protein
MSELEEKQMATEQDITDIKTAYEADKAEVQADVAELQTKIATLTATIAAGQGSSPNAQALVKEITDDAAALHASLNPTPPTTP